ncbi:MAG: putative acyl-CoA transferase/carnitine dehydratase [Caulobacteraceae bacterium]|nr:putative acyl-CoA transferase/carnitine dehydratase [Caulobacteraceae bacterium]
MTGALHGLRVIDCTHVIAGAWCSLLLADLGADVIKVETLGGETTRGRPDSEFKPFDFVNRNKRVIAVDWSKPEGADVVRKLVESADIFVENFRPGALARKGLGYDDLIKIKPDLIYASVSGFGQTGPYRDRGGFDLIAQAMSGIMSFTGELGSDKPVAAGVPLSDLNAGVFAALGVLAALNHRNVTGEGQYVETSLFESAMAYTMWETGAYLTTGAVATRAGTRHRLAAPYEAFKTADGHIVVGVNNQGLWARFCTALGDEAMRNDPRFAVRHARVDNRDALQERIEAIFAGGTMAQWQEKLLAVGVPCGPLNTIAEALDDPQIKARGLLAQVEGRQFTRAPLVMSKTPVEVKRGPGRIGQHTREVLAEAGYGADEIEALAADGAVGVEDPSA